MFILQVITDTTDVMPKPRPLEPVRRPITNPYDIIDGLSQSTTPGGTTPGDTSSGDDSFIPRGMGKYLVQGLAPFTYIASSGSASATLEAFRRLSSGRTLGYTLEHMVNVSRLQNIANGTSFTARFSRFFLNIGSRTQGIGNLVSRIPLVGRLATAGGGRLLPGLGCALAVGDNIYNWCQAFNLKKEEGESDEAFKERKSNAVTDATINTGCTVGGAIIGACIGGPVGAMIGAGIGNLVGRALQGGTGKTILKNIGRFFGFG